LNCSVIFGKTKSVHIPLFYNLPFLVNTGLAMMSYRQPKGRVVRAFHIISGALFLILLLPSAVLAQKTDIVVFKNGDRVTGEVKLFERGQVKFSTTAMGTVMIKWDNIAEVISDKSIQIELDSGDRVLGSVSSGAGGTALLVQTASGVRDISMDNVVRMEPLKKDRSFWQRLDGSIQFGLDYAQSSRVGNSHMSADAIFKEEKYHLLANMNYNFTSGSARNDTQRYFLGGSYRRKLRDRWFWLLNSSIESNDELGIDLRGLVGAGGGRTVWKTNFSDLLLFGGAAASRELRAADKNATQLEGQFGGEYSLYLFNPKKTDLSTTLMLFPSMTESGRWRGNFRLQYRWEMIKDLFWAMTYYYTFDNQPPPGAASEDTGINTSIGYSF